MKKTIFQLAMAASLMLGAALPAIAQESSPISRQDGYSIVYASPVTATQALADLKKTLKIASGQVITTTDTFAVLGIIDATGECYLITLEGSVG